MVGQFDQNFTGSFMEMPHAIKEDVCETLNCNDGGKPASLCCHSTCLEIHNLN